MSKDELQSYLDKNAKWHRDRRVTETEQRMKKWVDYYEMMAEKADSNERKLSYLADAEREKLKHQNLRAPDSRALLNQHTLQAPKDPRSLSGPGTCPSLDGTFLKEVFDDIAQDSQIGHK